MIVGTLIVVEGFSSMVLFFDTWLSGKGGERPLPERRHTQYDAVLGWTNIPNLTVRDMYGPGVFLRTNSRGFRGGRDVELRVPPGKLRVICSGDSFTLGFGVDDDHTWCQLLASLDPHLEPVNMGQAGYGIDQAYLWYKRDGNVLNHDVHIFAFITGDFWRMNSRTFGGVGKPILDVDNGHLIVKNVPVPHRGWYYAPWVKRFGSALRVSKTNELVTRVMGRLRPRQADGNDAIHDRTWDVALKVFESLQEMNQARKSALVLVWLPDRWEPSGASETWRRRLAAQAKQRGWTYIDLVHEMDQVPAAEFEGMFLSHLHYSVTGNKWVAQMMYQRISSLPQLSRH